MKVIKVDKDSRELLSELLNDLEKDTVIYLARFPEPIGELRYRDMLKKMFLSTGKCLAIVWLVFENNIRKIYSFLISAELKEGEVNDILELSGYVSGSLIEEINDEKIYKQYRETRYLNGKEILFYLEEVGNKYRDREIKATIKSALKQEVG
jgi:hypothetical protein